MITHQQIPLHVTVLYIFTIVNLLALFHVTLVEADVIVLKEKNATHGEEHFFDQPADFGPDLDDETIGRLVYVTPRNGCVPMEPPPDIPTANIWIALIARGDCPFGLKVLNAQKQHYNFAIVHNYPDDDSLQTMAGGECVRREIYHHLPGHVITDSGKALLGIDGPKVKIPSVFIGGSDGILLGTKYNYTSGYYIKINKVRRLQIMLWPFAVVVGSCFFLMVIFVGAKWCRDLRKKKKSRLSKKHLKKIPIKKYKKGDIYDTCAICLEDYEEGEKLRLLPCSHAYHVKCVDPWLLKNKRVCPVCKRKVIPGQDTESESDSDDEGASTSTSASETTPLLTGQRTRRQGGPLAETPRTIAFERSGLPEGVRGDITHVTETRTASPLITTGPVEDAHVQGDVSTCHEDCDSQSDNSSDLGPAIVQANINECYSSSEDEDVVIQPKLVSKGFNNNNHIV